MLNIKLPTNLLLIPTVALLSACGGGSDDAQFLPGPEGLNALFIEGQALTAKFEPLEASPSIPSSDDVTFNGIMALTDLESELDSGYIGDVVIDVDFASNALTATGTGFFFQSGEAPGQARDGALFFNSANVGLGGDVSLFSGTLTGVLDLGSGVEPLIGAGDGLFAGDNADMVAVLGGVNGTDLEFFILAD